MLKYTADEIQKITERVSLVDYFQYLENRGKTKFHKKYGKDYYFLTDVNKFSVSDDYFYDFKTGKGGKIIKAVMTLENKSWKESLDFLKDFSNTTISADLKKEFKEKRKNIDKISNENKSGTKIIRSIIPNNNKLIAYFESRGISKEILKENTKQVHYEVNGKQYFGIGLENQSKGIEIRNPMMKTKIGKNDFSVIEGTSKDKMFVFEGMTDMFSFLQLLKDNKRKNNQILVCLNSVTNIDKFIEKYKGYNGKMFLVLDGDDVGNTATKKIINAFEDKQVKDVRTSYKIYKGGNNDLNEYLKNKLYNNIKNSTLVGKINYDENTTSRAKQRGISNTSQNGNKSGKQDIRQIDTQSQPKQNTTRNHKREQNVVGNDVRNGLTSTIRNNNDERGRTGTGGTRDNQSEDRRKPSKSRRNGNRLESSGSRGTSLLNSTTNLPELDNLIQKYKGQKLTNEQVAEIVSVACFVSDDNKVLLKNNLNVTDDLKDLVNQYKTGGVAKNGRGVLDEYYTNIDIVNTIGKMLDPILANKENLSILEPSVGTGNFINAVADYSNAKIEAFEINDVTAKITKILHPDVDVNLRSFETQFIDDWGLHFDKEVFTEKYDVVIGNPPYGTHRGFYKGLGEEPKLSKYEDYFVKRSLDSMKENGVLAMVLPSSWLNSQKKLNNAELLNAYRLPVGSFAGTQVGTDIILLKKDSQKQNINISKYFKENQNKVLGEIREKTNRFGKLEKYVYGRLDEALAIIEKDNLQKEETTKNTEELKKWNDYKSLYKDIILDSDDFKYKVLQSIDQQSKDLAFSTLFSEILTQNKRLNSDLYAKYHKDKKFASSFFNDVKDLCLKQISIKSKSVEESKRQLIDFINTDKNGGRFKQKVKEYDNGSSIFSKDEVISDFERLYKKYTILNKDINEDFKNLTKSQLATLFDDIWKYINPIEHLKSELGENVTRTKESSSFIDKYGKEKTFNYTVTKGIINPNTLLQQAQQKEKKQSIQPSLFDLPTTDTIDSQMTSNVDDKKTQTTLNSLNKEYKKVVKEEPKQKDKKSIAIEKTKIALNLLEKVKFKTPAIAKEIDKYESLCKQLSFKENSYTKEELEKIIKSSDRIINSHKKRNKEIGYEIQAKPNIKKNVLKYQFSKNDEVVNTSIQNSSKLSKEQVEAFENTNYDGTLNDRVKHYKYANYIEGKWVHDFYYAEGNIYAKLEQLERDFANKHANGGTDNQYEKQKSLLESVLPKPKTLNEIIISPNHEFIHKFKLGKREVEKQRETYSVYGKSWKKYTEIEDFTLAHKFKDFVRELPSEAFQGSSSWEVCAFVDNETVTGSDKKRNALVRERRKEVANDLFKKFIKEEMTGAEKERFVNDFNRNYNNIHIPDYSQFPLFSKIYKNFKGRPLELTEVQKSGIGRLTTKGVGLLAHEVGFGKTLSGILSMYEAMERGTAKRPLIVVPNDNILKQWVETIYETIPNAKVNVLGNLGVNYNLLNFDNKDNEITLVTYSGFNNIGFNKEVTDSLAGKFSYISQNEMKVVKNSDDSITIKQESERDKQKRIEDQNELRGKIKKGKVYDWEDFGFDHLTFDEVHNANHIVGKVRIEDRRFSSDFRSQNQQTSALGINTWVASQYIQENYDGRNVTLLSATPFTNKPLEYYSILSLVANNRLEEKGYFNVNNFFETFMEADSEMEIDAKGEVKYKSNVKRFKNNSIFQQLLAEFIDIKGEEDNPELVRPNRINKEYKIKQNNLTTEQYELLNENFAEDDKGAILTHILNARLIAISPYLSPYYDDEIPTVKEFVENSPKLKMTMDLMSQNRKDKPSAGQIIYSELAVSEFPKLKEYLITEVGFADKEVAIITGQTSKTQRQKIQKDFNDGKIKVIIGSSAIQEGMNLQNNTSDMYLLSLPYNFTSLRQTEGRAWRQGNVFENIRINYMLTEDSIDVFMLQKLQAKQARYLEAMKKDVNILDISDIDTNELKTALITNPQTRAEIEIKVEKKRLEDEKSRLIADSSFVLRKFEKVTDVKGQIERARKEMSKHTEWAKENEYWADELKRDKLIINDLNEKLKVEIAKLEKNGIDVSAIESNIKLTEEKVSEIDTKIEGLPELKEELVEKYRKEKEEKDKLDNDVDWIQERMEENKSFYRLREEKPKQEFEMVGEKIRVFMR